MSRPYKKPASYKRPGSALGGGSSMGTPMMAPLPINLPSLRKESTSAAGGSGPESANPWRTVPASGSEKACMSLPSSPTLQEDEKGPNKPSSLSANAISPVAPAPPSTRAWRTSSAASIEPHTKNRPSVPTCFPSLGLQDKTEAQACVPPHAQAQSQPPALVQKHVSATVSSNNIGVKSFSLQEIIKPWSQSSSASNWLAEEISEMDYSVVPVFEDEKKLLLKEQTRQEAERQAIEANASKKEKSAEKAKELEMQQAGVEREEVIKTEAETASGPSPPYEYGRISILGHAHATRERQKGSLATAALSEDQLHGAAVPSIKPNIRSSESGTEWRRAAAPRSPPRTSSATNPSHMTVVVRPNHAAQPIYHSMPSYVPAPAPKWTPKDDPLVGSRLGISVLYQHRPKPTVLEEPTTASARIVTITMEQLTTKQKELRPRIRVIRIAMSQLVSTSEELKKKRSISPLHTVRLSIALLSKTRDYLLQLAVGQNARETRPAVATTTAAHASSTRAASLGSPSIVASSPQPLNAVLSSSAPNDRHHNVILFGTRFQAIPPPFSLTHSLRQCVASLPGSETCEPKARAEQRPIRKGTRKPSSTKGKDSLSANVSLARPKKGTCPQNSLSIHAGRGEEKTMLESSSWRTNK